MHVSLPRHDIVLLGAGHTNAHVLRMWKMAPLADARLTCISDHGVATYSGMLPGTLAGLYPAERMQIDLVRLCAAGNVRFLRGDVRQPELGGKTRAIRHRHPAVVVLGPGVRKARDGFQGRVPGLCVSRV